MLISVDVPDTIVFLEALLMYVDIGSIAISKKTVKVGTLDKLIMHCFQPNGLTVRNISQNSATYSGNFDVHQQ